MSRIQDKDDWKIHSALFATINLQWGLHTIDRFANNLNTQLPRFNLWFWCPGTEAVDTFTCDWGQEVNWVCPPPYLIPQTIPHASKTSSKGTLIMPAWPSAPYWPMLYPAGCEIASFIKEVWVLPKSQQMVLPGRLDEILPASDLLVVRCDFKHV